MKTFLIILMTIVLSGCITAPDPITGEGAWRFNVLENGNTGKLTLYEDARDIPVTKTDIDTVEAICGKHAWGCYIPPRMQDSDPQLLRDRIYIYHRAGKVTLYEEWGHALLGTEHNSCQGYGIGKDESACDWNTL